MTIASIGGVVLAGFIAAAGLVVLRRDGVTPASVGRVLRVLAFAGTVWAVVALLPFTVQDSGAAAGYLLGVPLLAAVCPLAAELTRRAVTATTTAAALVMAAWGLLLGLGIGMWFLLPAAVLAMAAVASMASPRTPVVGNQGA